MKLEYIIFFIFGYIYGAYKIKIILFINSLIVKIHSYYRKKQEEEKEWERRF